VQLLPRGAVGGGHRREGVARGHGVRAAGGALGRPRGGDLPRGRRGRCRLVGLAEPELARARGPRAPALGGQRLLGRGDLLLPRGQVGPRGVLGAAEAGPGAAAELQAAVVAVTRVDGPVPAALALRQGVPGLARGGRGAGRAERGQGQQRRSGTEAGGARRPAGAARGAVAGGAGAGGGDVRGAVDGGTSRSAPGRATSRVGAGGGAGRGGCGRTPAGAGPGDRRRRCPGMSSRGRVRDSAA
jgi:hypothetical protein